MTDAWAADVASIHSEAAGVMHLHVVRDRDLPAVMLGVLAGNRLALQLHPAATDTQNRIAEAPRHRSMLCASCPRSLRPKAFNCVAVIPAIDDPSRMLCLAVCKRCAVADLTP